MSSALDCGARVKPPFALVSKRIPVRRDLGRGACSTLSVMCWAAALFRRLAGCRLSFTVIWLDGGWGLQDDARN
jgi:hypothetical protein